MQIGTSPIHSAHNKLYQFIKKWKIIANNINEPARTFNNRCSWLENIIITAVEPKKNTDAKQ